MSTLSTQKKADNAVLAMFMYGGVAAIVALIVALTQWPSEETTTALASGNAIVAYSAMVVFGIAQAVILVAVVACGVRLGVHWSGLADSIEKSAAARRQGTATNGSVDGR